MFSARSGARMARSVRALSRMKTSPAVTHGVRGLQSSMVLTAESDKESKPPVSLIPSDEEMGMRERFIPITRRSLMRMLMQEDILNDEEKLLYEKFAASLDAAIVNRYHGILTELKTLFDPINPDKDTLETRVVNRKECVDNEFWLLQKLASVMDRANFNEVPQRFLEKALSEHHSREGVMVSVNTDRYDVLRFWSLGRELPEHSRPWYMSLYYKLKKRPPPEPLQYYKRVVVAARLKRDQKLMLKMFKQVPCNALEQLLPDGKIRMTNMDKNIIKATVAVGGLGVLVKVLGLMVNQDIHWTLILSCASALVALQSWTVYQNRKRQYLVDLTRMLYFKNIANNRGLLTLLVDRAEDETFKEALLAYTFLLASRAPSTRGKESHMQMPEELGSIPAGQLEHHVHSFIQKKTNMSVDFDSSESLTLLKSFGLLSESDDKLNILPLATAQRHLPQQPETIVLRQEVDVNDIEGFDRDAYLESEKELKREDVKSRKYGWY